VHIVEKEHNETWRRGRCLPSDIWISRRWVTAFCVALGDVAFLHRESGDDFRFVFVKDLKVFLPQVAHRTALCITDHNRHQYLIHLDFNLEGDNLRFFGLLRYQVRARCEGQPTQDNIQKRFAVHSHTDTAILRLPCSSSNIKRTNERLLA